MKPSQAVRRHAHEVIGCMQYVCRVAGIPSAWTSAWTL